MLSFASHQKTAIRRAALYALAWLDCEGNIDQIVEAMQSDRGKVSKDAANWLIRSPHLIAGSREALTALLRSENSTVRQQAAAVLEAGQNYAERWES